MIPDNFLQDKITSIIEKAECTIEALTGKGAKLELKLDGYSSHIPKISPTEIIEICEDEFQLERGRLLGKRGKIQVTNCRFIAIKMIRENYKYIVLNNLGFIFNRNHTVIIHALKVFEKYYQNEIVFREKTDTIRKEIQVRNEKLKVTKI